ncbi:MAG: hypothetical protein VX309_07130 [Pseudomonadota bacterium]|nr:hypothetical protein [Pseudomonadota bacterium]MEE3155279.1 hypothetical protein [Pseudomonadota bacterium]
MHVDLALHAGTKAHDTAAPRHRPQRGPWLQIVTQILQLAGPRAEFLRHCERPWSSATFAGARHTVALTFQGSEAIEDGEQFIEALADHEFVIPGHLVADAALRETDHVNGAPPRLSVEIEILLLDDI